MTFDEYQEGVINTWNTQIRHENQETNALLGLMGEVGEIAEFFKKSRYHNATFSLDYEYHELGDILYYLTALIVVRGFSLESIAAANAKKLKERYPNGFVKGGGIR